MHHGAHGLDDASRGNAGAAEGCGRRPFMPGLRPGPAAAPWRPCNTRPAPISAPSTNCWNATSSAKKDGFPRKIDVGRLIKPGKGGKEKVVIVPTTVEEKFIHDTSFRTEEGESTGGSGEGEEGEVIGEQPVRAPDGEAAERARGRARAATRDGIHRLRPGPDPDREVPAAQPEGQGQEALPDPLHL